MEMKHLLGVTLTTAQLVYSMLPYREVDRMHAQLNSLLKQTHKRTVRNTGDNLIGGKTETGEGDRDT